MDLKKKRGSGGGAKTWNQKRFYSSRAKKYTSVKIYKNAATACDKLNILKENKGKSVIYLWKNLINNKIYVGSAVDLSRRF